MVDVEVSGVGMDGGEMGGVAVEVVGWWSM